MRGQEMLHVSIFVFSHPLNFPALILSFQELMLHDMSSSFFLFSSKLHKSRFLHGMICRMSFSLSLSFLWRFFRILHMLRILLRQILFLPLPSVLCHYLCLSKSRNVFLPNHSALYSTDREREKSEEDSSDSVLKSIREEKDCDVSFRVLSCLDDPVGSCLGDTEEMSQKIYRERQRFLFEDIVSRLSFRVIITRFA